MTANRPEQPLKTQQLRKRYRQLRRRQLAGFLLLLSFAVAVLIVVGIGIFAMRSCATHSEGALRTKLEAERGADSLPQVALERSFSPAPWLTTVSDSALFCATDSEQRQPGYANYPIDGISAIELSGDHGTLWKSKVSAEYMGLAAVDKSLVAYNYQQVEPKMVELHGLDPANGRETWTQSIEAAQSPSFAVSGKVFVVAYYMSDGYRIVGYNAASGVKAWGFKLGLADELGGFDISTGFPPLALQASPDLISYRLGASLGFLDSGNGKLLRQVKLPTAVDQLAFDWNSRSCLFTGEPDESGLCNMYRMPLSAGVPVLLHRFIPDQGIPQLVHYAGNALLAYWGREAESESAACHVVYFERGASTPLANSALSHGIPIAAAAFPDGTQGALVSLCDSLDRESRPKGYGALLRVSPASGQAERHSRLVHPVVGLLPFKQDIVMVSAGGEVRAFAAPIASSLQLARLGYPECYWSYSPGNTTLLVTASPRSLAAGEPGGRLQALVLK